MSSKARIEANRRNALKSTGPRTPEGKARSAQNALKHGLASISPHSFLTVEDKSAFERMLAGYLRIHQPAHADELDLVTDAVFCKWRQQRIWNVEAQGIEIAIAQNQYDLQAKLPKATAAAHVANAFLVTAEQTQLLRRYEAQLHRQYLRNLKELRDLQAQRANLPSTLEDLDPPPSAPVQPPTTQPTKPQPDPDRQGGEVPGPKPVNSPPNRGPKAA